MNIKRRNAVLLLLLSFAALTAQQRVTPSAEPTAQRLQQHISYLASDALDGRRTGTQGANDAAHYIAGEFARLGLRPAMQSAGAKKPSALMAQYLQSFPYVATVQLGSGNVLKVRDKNYTVGTDWMPLGFSANGNLPNVPAVFVGYGISAPDLKHDDYAGEKASGKIAFAIAGTPDGDNPHGQFARYEGVRWKAVAARNANAKALVIVSREPNFKDDKLSQLSYDNSAGDAGLPVVVISREAMGGADGFGNLEALAKLDPANKQVADFGAMDPAPTVAVALVRKESPAYNVIGTLEGSDPVLRNEAIIVGAHYDHLGRGGEGSLAPRAGEIHHGADDNASGVAGMLELARLFSAQRPRPKRTLVFMAFSGEEEGLLGSNYYVNHPIRPLANTVAMINMDMIGRMKDSKLIVGGVGTAREWREMLGTQNAQTTGAGVVAASPISTLESARNFNLTLQEDGYGPSDHSSFYAKQIPVLFFWTGTHNDYHKPSDTFEKINYTDEVRVLALVAQVVRALTVANQRPTYTVAKSDSQQGRSTGFRVYLGTIPNYSDSNDGLLLDGIRDDSPAAKAGLKAGDKIVKIGTREIKNVYDYTYALGEMKAGEEYAVEVMRGGEKLSLKIKPEARK
jgi:aminopeptidase YwaD